VSFPTATSSFPTATSSFPTATSSFPTAYLQFWPGCVRLTPVVSRVLHLFTPLHTSSHLRYTEPTLTKFRQQRKALDASSEGSRPNLVNSKILKRGGSSIEIAP
jgi:hypothetical protein